VRIEVRESLSRIAAIRTADQWPPPRPAHGRFTSMPPTTPCATHRPPVAAVAAAHRGGVSFRWRVAQATDIIGPMRLRVRVSADRPDLTLFAVIRKVHHGREVVFEGSYGFTEDIVTHGWLRASHRAHSPPGRPMLDARAGRRMGRVSPSCPTGPRAGRMRSTRSRLTGARRARSSPARLPANGR